MYICPRCSADPHRVHHPLGDGLIHGHGTAQIAGAGVGYAQQIQRRLDPAVLAVGAVHGQKDHVRHGADCQYILADHGRTLVLPCSPDGVQVRRGFLNGCLFQQTIRRVEDILQLAMVVFQTHEHIHKDGLMSLFPQRAAHAAAADQSYMAFGTETTGQNHDLHKKTSLFMADANTIPILHLLY